MCGASELDLKKKKGKPKKFVFLQYVGSMCLWVSQKPESKGKATKRATETQELPKYLHSQPQQWSGLCSSEEPAPGQKQGSCTAFCVQSHQPSSLSTVSSQEYFLSLTLVLSA